MAAAREALTRTPDSADAMLWLGRQTAAAGRVRDAIAIFTKGIAQFPADPRFYRHRGHRYVTVREFDNAIADLAKAAQLIKGKPDQPEPSTADAKVKDDQQYYDRLMMHKGAKKPEELLSAGKDPVSEATLAYGVANWHLYNGRKEEATALFKKIVTGPNWMPFGFIAAEAELARRPSP
ncbi:MAG: tetratricopeptide repeat protein [Rhodospirillaceae bacterium]